MSSNEMLFPPLPSLSAIKIHSLSELYEYMHAHKQRHLSKLTMHMAYITISQTCTTFELSVLPASSVEMVDIIRSNYPDLRRPARLVPA